MIKVKTKIPSGSLTLLTYSADVNITVDANIIFDTKYVRIIHCGFEFTSRFLQYLQKMDANYFSLYVFALKSFE